jgi:hypothetical protein
MVSIDHNAGESSGLDTRLLIGSMLLRCRRPMHHSLPRLSCFLSPYLVSSQDGMGVRNTQVHPGRAYVRKPRPG